MDERQKIGELATVLKTRGLDETQALFTSLNVRRGRRRERLVRWMEEHPKATPTEVLKEFRRLCLEKD